MPDMFERASRLRLRFETPRGLLSVEDLWLLPLESKISNPNLDDIARFYFRQLESKENVSFVRKEDKTDETTQLQFDVVKYVIDVRLEEADKAKKEADTAARKQKLLAIIADKEDEGLKGKSIEELMELVNQL